MVTSANGSACLGEAGRFEMHVFDLLTCANVATKLARNGAGVAAMCGAPQASESQAVSQYLLSCCASSCDRGVAVLGLFVSFIAKSAGAVFVEAEGAALHRC